MALRQSQSRQIDKCNWKILSAWALLVVVQAGRDNIWVCRLSRTSTRLFCSRTLSPRPVPAPLWELCVLQCLRKQAALAENFPRTRLSIFGLRCYCTSWVFRLMHKQARLLGGFQPTRCPVGSVCQHLFTWLMRYSIEKWIKKTNLESAIRFRNWNLSTAANIVDRLQLNAALALLLEYFECTFSAHRGLFICTANALIVELRSWVVLLPSRC